MDEIDRKLISLLQSFGRSSYAELGGVVGLSVSAVNDRIKKLQAQGIILGWGAHVSPKAMGLSLTAFIQVLITGREAETELRAILKADPSVEELHHITGSWSYLVKVRVADTDALEEWLDRVLKPIEGVARTETLIALSTIKERAPIGWGGAP